MNTKQVAERLRHVYDPDLGLDIVALGLIYGINVEDDAIAVTITMTSPGCPFSDVIAESARTALLGPGERDSVKITIAREPPWDPRMIEPASRARLGLR